MAERVNQGLQVKKQNIGAASRHPAWLERMQEQEVRLRREALIHMDAGILSCMGEVIKVF